MTNREISLWVDERWYAAINKQLKNETLEEHLESVIDELCDQLPEQVYERISSEIWEEQKQAKEQEPEILTGRRLLFADDISFSEDIVQEDDHLEFYMDVAFAAEDVFAFPGYADDSDDWLNVYANYSLETGQVCDTLDVHLVHGDGGEQNYRYPLTEAEKALLLTKMENYCQHCWGQSLEEVRGECLSEQQPSQEMQL